MRSNGHLHPIQSYPPTQRKPAAANNSAADLNSHTWRQLRSPANRIALDTLETLLSLIIALIPAQRFKINTRATCKCNRT